MINESSHLLPPPLLTCLLVPETTLHTTPIVLTILQFTTLFGALGIMLFSFGMYVRVETAMGGRNIPLGLWSAMVTTCLGIFLVGTGVTIYPISMVELLLRVLACFDSPTHY